LTILLIIDQVCACEKLKPIREPVGNARRDFDVRQSLRQSLNRKPEMVFVTAHAADFREPVAQD
jgi:hypothetical protein